jgi:hypothetical protein
MRQLGSEKVQCDSHESVGPQFEPFRAGAIVSDDASCFSGG